MKKQVLILITGYNASGKSTISKKIMKSIDINRVNGDLIRDFLIDNIKFYHNAVYSHPNKKINSLNSVMSPFRLDLITELLKQNESVLVDGAGSIRARRKKRLDIINNFPDKKIITIIIETSIQENELIDRLKKRDKKNKKNKWVREYINVRKDVFEPVEKNEADFVFKYNQNNLEEIIKEIKDIINKK